MWRARNSRRISRNGPLARIGPADALALHPEPQRRALEAEQRRRSVRSFDHTARAQESGADGQTVAKLSIRDNGPGLAQESIRSVFDPFFMRGDNPQEFGINLMACFFIIYHHGGKIEVQSKPGEGTTFVATLPLNPAERSLVQNDRDFLPQMLANEALWEKLLAGTA